jgi:hypothetical protein
MIRWLGRLLLLRVLPRRLVPILTAVELFRLARSARQRRRVAVNEPTNSRTAPPPPAP